MEAVFEGRRRLLPRPTDLSFFNWVTQSSAANHTPTFQAHPFPLQGCAHMLTCAPVGTSHGMVSSDGHAPRVTMFLLHEI